MNTPEALLELFFVSREPIGRGLPSRLDKKTGKMIAGPWRDTRKTDTGTETSDRPISAEMISRHLAGTLLHDGSPAMLMPYVVDKAGMAVATYADLDVAGKDHADLPQHFDTSDAANHAALALADQAQSIGLRAWIETTRNGGRRVEVFHDRLPAADARDLGQLLLKRAGLHPAIEVFPKQAISSVTGNGVFLPYWGGASPGRQVITDPLTGEMLTADAFAAVALEARSTPKAVRAIVQAARDSGEITTTRTPSPRRDQAEGSEGQSGDVNFIMWPVQTANCPWLAQQVETAESGQELPYDDWLRLGGHLRIYGEAGRKEFHRLSGFDGRYDAVETDHKFDSLTGGSPRCDTTPCGRDPYVDCSLPAGKVSSSHWPYRGFALKMADEKKITADGLPMVETNGRHLRDESTDALDALIKGNAPPAIFVRGGQLARVHVNEKNRAVIAGLTIPMLRGHMARCANFVSTSEKRGVVPVAPPKDVVEDVLALPEWAGVPPLTGIVTAPVFSADGRLDTRPGYHSAARLFYHETCPVPIPSTEPTAENVARARSLILDDLLGDFPFADEASRAHAVALLLLPFVRPMIDGPTPLHLIDAPAAGTGKGLLAKACTVPFTPSGAPVKAPPTEEAEWSKTLTSVFSDGDSHLLFDNVRFLNSPSFFAALTSTLYKDRILSTNRTAEFENRLVWLATCNNIQGNDELTRRSIWIRLDAGVERPESREGFQHPDLSEWAIANRGALIGATLTLVNAWISAGKPPYAGSERPLGSFEAWTRVIGGILTAAGIDGFLANREEQRSRVDTETASWHGFVEAWRDRYADALVVPADLFPLAAEWMPGKLGDGTDRSQKTKFGGLLTRHRDKVFAGHKIIFAGKATSGISKNSPQYRLEPVSQPKIGRPGIPGIPFLLPRVAVSEEDNNIHIGQVAVEVSQVSQVSLVSDAEDDWEEI